MDHRTLIEFPKKLAAEWHELMAAADVYSRPRFIERMWFRATFIVVAMVVLASPLSIRYCQRLMREAELDNVREALLRDELEIHSSAGRYPVCFVSVEGNRNPRPSLLSRFRSEKIPALPISLAKAERSLRQNQQSGAMEEVVDGYSDPVTGGRGLAISIDALARQGPDEFVGNCSYRGQEGYSGSRAVRIIRRDGQWRVAREALQEAGPPEAGKTRPGPRKPQPTLPPGPL